MRYYKRNVGDYVQATVHLSMLEDGAYNRALDVYYATEQPLPRDAQRLYRLLRATTKQERAAVDVVMAEFFEAHEDGYRHGRVEREIETMAVKAEANRANGRTGGRPKGNRNRTEQEPNGLPDENPTITLPTTHNPLLQTSSTTVLEDPRPEISEGRDDGEQAPNSVARFRQRWDGAAGGYAGDDRSAPGKVAAAIAKREADRLARGE